MIGRLRAEAFAAAARARIIQTREQRLAVELAAVRAERDQWQRRAEKGEADLAEVILERDVLRLHVGALHGEMARGWHPSNGGES